MKPNHVVVLQNRGEYVKDVNEKGDVTLSPHHDGILTFVDYASAKAFILAQPMLKRNANLKYAEVDTAKYTKMQSPIKFGGAVPSKNKMMTAESVKTKDLPPSMATEYAAEYVADKADAKDEEDSTGVSIDNLPPDAAEGLAAPEAAAEGGSQDESTLDDHRI